MLTVAIPDNAALQLYRTSYITAAAELLILIQTTTAHKNT